MKNKIKQILEHLKIDINKVGFKYYGKNNNINLYVFKIDKDCKNIVQIDYNNYHLGEDYDLLEENKDGDLISVFNVENGMTTRLKEQIDKIYEIVK